MESRSSGMTPFYLSRWLLWRGVVRYSKVSFFLLDDSPPKAFLPRDAMHKRGLCRHAFVSVCLYVCVCVPVCVSVTFVDHVKTNKDILNFFSQSGRHTVLVFSYQTGWRYYDGNYPPNRDVEFRWRRQKSRFWTYIRL